MPAHVGCSLDRKPCQRSRRGVRRLHGTTRRAMHEARAQHHGQTSQCDRDRARQSPLRQTDGAIGSECDADQCHRRRRPQPQRAGGPQFARGLRCSGCAAGDRRGIQRGQHRVGGLRPCRRLLCDQRHDQRRDVRWCVGAHAGDVRRHLADVRRQLLLRRGAGEDQPSRARLVQQAAQRIQVRATIHRFVAECLLGRHVRRRADREAGAGECHTGRTAARACRVERLGDAEVGDDRRAGGQQDVVRLDVAMHDAARMCIRECAGDITRDAHDFRHRQRSAHLLQPVAQRASFHERHRVPRHTIEVAGREDRDDVGLLQARRGEQFAAEAFHGQLTSQFGRQHLQCHPSPQCHFLGGEHAAHAAAAQLALHTICGAKLLLQALERECHERGEEGCRSGECHGATHRTSARSRDRCAATRP